VYAVVSPVHHSWIAVLARERGSVAVTLNHASVSGSLSQLGDYLVRLELAAASPMYEPSVRSSLYRTGRTEECRGYLEGEWL
jgi:hypothetical protein